MRTLLTIFLCSCLAFACKQDASKDKNQGVESEEDTTIISYGTNNKEAQEKYEAAKKAYEESPDDAEALIWYGRRAAYLGNFDEAIDIYSEGINKFPKDARMLRHRGHRLISTKKYTEAIRDLTLASQLIEGTEDQIEQDGIPNAENTPISTLHGNIWYHLALAHYLNQDLKSAAKIYEKRFETHQNDDNIVSATHWYYMTLKGLGRDEEAKALLEPINKDMNIIENFAYHQLCLFYKGELSVIELQEMNEDGLTDAHLYGLGNWNLYEAKDSIRANEYFDKLLNDGNKSSFAYLAAESDYLYQVGGEK